MLFQLSNFYFLVWYKNFQLVDVISSSLIMEIWNWSECFSFFFFYYYYSLWVITTLSIVFAVLDFISDEAVDDACTVSFYLSECDQLRATASYGSIRSQLRTEMNESDSIPQQVAALVAVRGVLYGNSHPSPSRFALCTSILYLIYVTLHF